MNAIGSNATIINCAFHSILILDAKALFELFDKGAYYSQLPYAVYKTYVVFENVSFVNISNLMDSSQIIPLIIYGSHSPAYPMSYYMKNITFLNNIARKIFLLFK